MDLGDMMVKKNRWIVRSSVLFPLLALTMLFTFGSGTKAHFPTPQKNQTEEAKTLENLVLRMESPSYTEKSALFLTPSEKEREFSDLFQRSPKEMKKAVSRILSRKDSESTLVAMVTSLFTQKNSNPYYESIANSPKFPFLPGKIQHVVNTYEYKGGGYVVVPDTYSQETSTESEEETTQVHSDCPGESDTNDPESLKTRIENLVSWANSYIQASKDEFGYHLGDKEYLREKLQEGAAIEQEFQAIRALAPDVFRYYMNESSQLEECSLNPPPFPDLDTFLADENFLLASTEEPATWIWDWTKRILGKILAGLGLDDLFPNKGNKLGALKWLMEELQKYGLIDELHGDLKQSKNFLDQADAIWDFLGKAKKPLKKHGGVLGKKIAKALGSRVIPGLGQAIFFTKLLLACGEQLISPDPKVPTNPTPFTYPNGYPQGWWGGTSLPHERINKLSSTSYVVVNRFEVGNDFDNSRVMNSESSTEAHIKSTLKKYIKNLGGLDTAFPKADKDKDDELDNSEVAGFMIAAGVERPGFTPWWLVARAVINMIEENSNGANNGRLTKDEIRQVLYPNQN